MTTVVNYTDRVFNLKIAVNSNRRIKIKLQPGVNEIKDEAWEAFASKDGKKVDSFVERLIENGDLEYGDNIRSSKRVSTMPKSNVKADVKTMKPKGKGDKK